jgi:diguanylate cyclase (GGDEF)-like protein/PAS domain S-box-containing protein
MSLLGQTSILSLVCLLLALIATLLVVLYAFQRRDLRAVEDFADEVQSIATGQRGREPLELTTGKPGLAGLASAFNQLLERGAAPARRTEPANAALFAELGDRVHEIVIVHSETIQFANRQFASLVGIDPSELIGRKLEDLVPPEYSDLVGENIRRRLAGEFAPERYELEMVGLQGQLSLLEMRSVATELDGRPALLITGVEVVPTQALAALKHETIEPVAPSVEEASTSESPATSAVAATALPAAALRALVEALVTTDVSGNINFANPAAELLLGASGAAMLGQPLEQIVGIVDESDRSQLIDPVRQALTGIAPVTVGRRALLLARGSGAGAGGGSASERSIELSAAPIKDESGKVSGAVILLHDVTELRGLARQMSYQATHDALTGLVNRPEFEHRLDEAISVARRGDATHVLCFLDLDRFKLVNDTSGHIAGDSMLREVAKVLRDAVRDSDTVARLGGDEFGMLLVGCPLEKARQIADDVCRAVNNYRFVWRDRIFNIGVSIGLVELSRESGTLEDTLSAADSACYVAKKQGSGSVSVYSARDEALARHTGEIQWLQRLQSALKNERFELYYQTILPADGASGVGPAMEVLVRLKDDAGHDIPPTDFVRAAERYRLMGLVDRWVVQTTLAAVGRGAVALPGRGCIAINLSPQTLVDQSFLEFVVELFDRTGVQPAQVCFEITESAVVTNLDQARRFVGVLHGIGCQFALDDFGSGIGSFSNLKSLPLDYLKIDGSFMRNLGRDTVNQAMVTAMIKLARTLNFKVIAEQVEDADSLDAVRRMGVDYVQGFAVARPQPLAIAA